MNPTTSPPTTSGSGWHGAVPAWLTPHRDLGPLEALLARPGRLPVPQVLGALLAVLLLVVPALAQLVSGGAHLLGAADAGATPLGPSWAWAGVAVGLATLAMAGRSLPRLDWPLPALLRGVEYGTVLLLVGASPWAYLLLAVLAAHHYGIVYRVRLSDAGSQRWSSLLNGGWPVRCAVLVVAAATDTVEVVVAVMALVLAPLITWDAVTSWLRLGQR